MPNMPLIELEGVSVEYRIRHGVFSVRRYKALESVSFDVREGETLGVIGRNGAGKSTILRLLAEIILPDTGRITRRRPITVSLLNLQVGFSRALTGRDNAILGAMLLGLARAEAQERVQMIGEFSELSDWLDEPLHTYSAGMKARLGFAVAMEVSPDVLLVDEVLGVGDQRFREKSARALKKKMRENQTTVFVSHQLPMLRGLCDRTVWIEEGVTHMIGETPKVLKEYERWNREQRNKPLSGKRGWAA
jgi:lipopolysaccharide transport system ATP-binding protein